MQYDFPSARQLIAAINDVVTCLRGQGACREEFAHSVMKDFAGPYSRACSHNLSAEVTDRIKLISTLNDLADGVRVSMAEAEEEQQRVLAHTQWVLRQPVATAQFQFANASQGAVYDPEPSANPIRPTPFYIRYSALDRIYSGLGTESDKSSADVDALRRFTAGYRRLDYSVDSLRINFASALSAFESNCSWAMNGSIIISSGFSKYVEENFRMAWWIEAIAEAFEKAGSEAVANLKVVFDAKATPPHIATSSDSAVGIAKAIADGIGDATTVGESAAIAAGTGLSRFAPRAANGRFVAHATARFGQGWQALHKNSWVAKPGKAASVAKLGTASKWLGGIGVALGFVEGVTRQVTKDADNSSLSAGGKAWRATASAATIGFGGWAGAAAGAKVGALVGSLGGPVGTVIGGLVGGMIGEFLGSSVSERVTDVMLAND